MVDYFEDIEVGVRRELGSYRMSDDEIKEFAEQYDPLPIHTDAELASRSRHEGVIASGFHTFAATNRIVTENFKSNLAVIAGLGIDDLRWYNPVRPEDTLTAEMEVLEKRTSESDPNRGIFRLDVTASNQDGDDVISFVDTGMVEVRETP
ncbi:MaoC family dehydratase [Natrarchaeobius halalkaliphilus]|nr:MaoC family dehydratase [Natrarchaeobius halalkaliphilus]